MRVKRRHTTKLDARALFKAKWVPAAKPPREAKCHVYRKYVVFTQSCGDIVGDRYWVKAARPGLSTAAQCARTGPPYLIKQLGCEAEYLVGVLADRLLIDSGTSEVRGLSIHDLRTGKSVFSAMYNGSVTHAGGRRIRYERQLPGGQLEECDDTRVKCLRARKKAFLALKRRYRPWFDKAPLPSCPEPHPGFFVQAQFVSSWILDVRTLKKRKGRNLDCTHTPE